MTRGFFEAKDDENLIFHHDAYTGLKAVVAIYSTALGPALGGLRFYPYARGEDAVDDAIRLARAMAHKNALAGLALGGGKAVIIGDPSTDKTPELLRAYAQVVQSLEGRYVTACDAGTSTEDMDLIARDCTYVVGTSTSRGGAGDPSLLTAYGVFRGMAACAEHVWGTPSLAGRRVGVAGVGKVGTRLVQLLVENGASVLISDIHDEAIDVARRAHPAVDVAVDTDNLIRSDLEIYAPCAMGGSLDDHAVSQIRARIVCGAENNQLQRESLAADLHHRQVVYAPDYVVNAGGVIHVAQELGGAGGREAELRVAAIYETTKEILERAAEQGISPAVIAQQRAEERIRTADRGRQVASAR
ncbi:valine dehydrogenase [Amycolatopsis sp. NBC_01488]|uniref:Glu/Leu/Phe/Val dehydrogenase family protein n=1 Tax=Amycolatopsis sp. NBC_01488 TaxID=2903563 RepID=UPI002E2CD557|nr:Glu/Leu/Phe/Val dehydrogenase dimerization domain-containing protein [Amycolatopsis sp. NBC_01488]